MRVQFSQEHFSQFSFGRYCYRNMKIPKENKHFGIYFTEIHNDESTKS